VKVQIRHRDGRRLAVKQARGVEEVEALHREARMLTLAQHPGVVELIELRDLDPVADDDDGHDDPAAEMITRHVGHQSLATFAPRQLDHVAAIVAACAETVADLHSVSIVHRRLDPSHVLIDEQGRPVLCGFGGATLVGETPALDATPGRPAIDVADLGRLLTHIADGPPESDPIPDRRFTKRTRAATFQRRALLNLADQASAETVTARPSARSLAAAIRAVVPDATLTPLPAASNRPLPTRPTITAPRVDAHRVRTVPEAPSTTTDAPQPAPDRQPPPHHRRRRAAIDGRGLPLAAGMCGIVALAFGVVSASHGDRPTLAGDRSTPIVNATASVPPPGTAGTPPTSEPAPRGCATTVPNTSPSITAGACTRSAPVDGVITNGGHRFAIGEPGDEVLIGDWTCRGATLPAVIRPATGEVFLFDQWASAGHDEAARPAMRVEPGSHLETADATSGCPTLLARSSDDQTMIVRPLGAATDPAPQPTTSGPTR
jgi:hypothetical protein